MITFARETFAQCYPDMAPLLREHWEALARNREIVPLAVDEAVYQAAEARDALVAVTARDAGALVGYAVYFLRRHPHYNTTLWATNDVFWITPDARRVGVGKRLFEFVETTLKGLGVVVMNTSYKLQHPEAGPLLQAMGHEPIEMVHQKVLV